MDLFHLYIRNNIHELMSQVDACIEYAKNFTHDPVKKVLDKRRKRLPSKFDENPSTFAVFKLHSHFCRCLEDVLYSLLTGYGDTIKQCLACVRTLAIILKPPLDIKSKVEMIEVLEIFPPPVTIQEALKQSTVNPRIGPPSNKPPP